MLLSKRILAQIEQKHDIKLTRKQADFMEIMYGRYIKPDWNMHDFERGLRIALLLYPSNHQSLKFASSPLFEQICLDLDALSLS
jgi:hypothetical protein